ncbi:hypothetical protein BGY98DRAFT_1178106 [Russula aff. rugulosa BPL654]|nr:hypothetical protein BGY98DRAFT_1178106 [Russula aff. rugulosa BPL654]
MAPQAKSCRSVRKRGHLRPRSVKPGQILIKVIAAPATAAQKRQNPTAVGFSLHRPGSTPPSLQIIYRILGKSLKKTKPHVPEGVTVTVWTVDEHVTGVIFGTTVGLGADEVSDYRDEGVVEKIRAAADNVLNITIDTISEGRTPEQVTGANGDKGGRPIPVFIQPNGIAGVKNGLQHMWDGKVRAQKLTYRVAYFDG